MKEAFLNRMKLLLQEEYEEYVKTLDMPMYRGVRVNTLKCAVEDFTKEFPHPLSVSPFCKESFYISPQITSLGNHPFHSCGLFYMQEPSASSAVEILDVREGEWVLDLCAAPGGKSTQIAAKLNHTGCLLSNEIDAGRASVLLSNMERLGVGENIITCAKPEVLCTALQGHFDKVLVDAPCSGEGMFKKHDSAMEGWSEEHVNACRYRQLHILESAYKALKQDGILVYSTCTYAVEENEQVVYEFLKAHPDMELVDSRASFGRGGFAYEDLPVSYVRRIFPMDRGEGHFIAKMRRISANEQAKLVYEKEKKLPNCVISFFQEQLSVLPMHWMMDEQRVYVRQAPFLRLKNIRILRQGIACGEVRGQRLEPHHHFYLSAFLRPYLKNTTELTKEEAVLFYSGNVLPKEHRKGYTALTYHGYVLGFGKGDGVCIKNKLPKGLRCSVDGNLF